MLFWIITIIFAASIAGIIIFGRSWKTDDLHTASCITTVLSGATFAVMVIILVVQYVGVDGCVKSSEARYESLVYQYENELYDNDNDIGKKELMNQIQDWNEELAFYKEMQCDFWIGIFIPNVFDQFKYIDLDTMKG